MLALLIILVLAVSIWIGVCYLITNLVVRIAIKISNGKLAIRKTWVFIISLLLAGSSICWFLFTTPATNYQTGYLESFQEKYKVTLKGKRVPMSHDLFSALLRKTYEDSISYIIPRPIGVIQGREIIAIGYSNYKPTGTIKIQKQEMTIELFDTRNENRADTWNGKYRLEPRQKMQP